MKKEFTICTIIAATRKQRTTTIRLAVCFCIGIPYLGAFPIDCFGVALTYFPLVDTRGVAAILPWLICVIGSAVVVDATLFVVIPASGADLKERSAKRPTSPRIRHVARIIEMRPLTLILTRRGLNRVTFGGADESFGRSTGREVAVYAAS